MKKIILLLISVVMCVTFISCDNLGNNENNGHNNGNNGNNGNNNENPINQGENNNLTIPENLVYLKYKKNDYVLEFTKTGVKINNTNYTLVNKTTEQNVTYLHFNNDLTINFILILNGQLNSVTFQSLGLSGMGWSKYLSFIYQGVLFYNSVSKCHIYFYDENEMIFINENHLGYDFNLHNININNGIIEYELIEDFTNSGKWGIQPDNTVRTLYVNPENGNLEFGFKNYSNTGWERKEKLNYNIPLPAILKNSTWKNSDNVTFIFGEYFGDNVTITGLKEDFIFIEVTDGLFYYGVGNKYTGETEIRILWKDSTMSNDPAIRNRANLIIDTKNNKFNADITARTGGGKYNGYDPGDILYSNFTKQN